MSIRNLDIESMIEISGGWITPEAERPLIEGVPLLAPFLEELEKAHHALVRMQHAGTEVAAQRKALTGEATALDELHDRKLRGIYGVLTAFADLADDTDTAAGYLDIADRLFPAGLKGAQRSYLDEAAEAALVSEHLTEEIRHSLSNLPVPGGSLMAELEAWLDAGKALGDVEQKRRELGEGQPGAEISMKDVAAARSRWIRVVNTVLQVLELVPSLEASARSRLLAPLESATAKAERPVPDTPST